MGLAATKLLPGFTRNRSNHCRPKRLKLEHQTAALRPQYDGTKNMTDYDILSQCNSAGAKIDPEYVIADTRGDEPQMNL
jgi:hypothetical protein